MSDPLSPLKVRPTAARLWRRGSRRMRAAFSPWSRYRHAKAIHAARVALAMFTSIAMTTGMDIPHGIWASVTLLVVIGGLQHHGNIRKKAAERALGTLIGATAGLGCIALEQLVGGCWLTYMTMSLLAGSAAYYAIGRAGYVALLAAITMCIVAGHGDNDLSVGLWRSANVLFGIGIALAFSFALPLYATYAWRYRFADNLRLCARLVAGVPRGIDAGARRRAFGTLGERLVQLRSLMPSVAKEIGVPLAWLESLQREHRVLLAALDVLLELREQRPIDRQASADGAAAFNRDVRYLRDLLVVTSRALRVGRTRQLTGLRHGLRDGAEAGWVTRRDDRGVEAPRDGEAGKADDAGTGHHTPLRGDELIGQLIVRVERIRMMLLEHEPGWNIERRAATHGGAAPTDG